MLWFPPHAVDSMSPAAWANWFTKCLWEVVVGWPTILSIGFAMMDSRTISRMAAMLVADVIVVVVVAVLYSKVTIYEC